MGKRVIAIRSLYEKEDTRLKDKVVVPCQYMDKAGKIRYKEIKVTEAEKRTIECLAMRLFMEHRRVVHKTKRDEGRVELSAYLLVGNPKDAE